jgi:hypothetical protein
MKKYLCTIMAVSALLFSSCTDTSSDLPAPTKTELLTNKNWRIISQTATTNTTTTTTDTFGPQKDCNKDDIFIYGTDGKFTWDEGATKCDPADDQVFITGTWVFADNETKIVLTGLGIGGESEIQELTETKLMLKEVNNDQGVITTTITTYSAQ